MNKLSPGIYIGMLLAALFLLSLAFRVLLPYDLVFSAEGIKFTTTDAYYYVHLVDNLVHNFPHLTGFDPFFVFPGGSAVPNLNFFNWFMGGIIWLFGLGSPTQQTVDAVGVFIPPVLAALTIIPAYVIGRTLFNRWAGVLAAGLMAVFPGEYLGRTILGNADTPAVEVLFTTTALAFLVLAIKTAGDRGLTFDHLLHRDWKVLRRPLIYSLLAGVFFGLYLITWQGALLFVFIVTAYFILQTIINHLQRRPSAHLAFAGFLTFLPALIIYLPFILSADFVLSIVVAMLVPPALALISRLMSARDFRLYLYPVTLFVLAGVFLGVFYGLFPGVLGVMFEKFGLVFNPGGATAATTQEMAPLLAPSGSFTTQVAWGQFTTSFFLVQEWPVPGLAMISFALLIFLAVKRRRIEEGWLLFLLWTVVILIAALAQRRFAYYLVVNVALLSGYLSWKFIHRVGLKKISERTAGETGGDSRVDAPKPGTGQKKSATRKKELPLPVYYLNMVLAIVLVFFLVFFLNIRLSADVAARTPFAPSDAWQESLVWMEGNTPPPLGDNAAYFELYDAPPPGETFQYPESAYAVTAWWDYGYWITRIAKRIPSANPGQQKDAVRRVADLFLTEDISRIREMMTQMGSRYIIADYDVAIGKFYALATWSEQDPGKYMDTYYLDTGDSVEIVPVFFPEYYRTLFVRLYNFDGKAVTETVTGVISYRVLEDDDGKQYRLITGYQEFTDYNEAVEFIAGQETGNHIIASINPFVSPIALEALDDFQLIYGSSQTNPAGDVETIPQVKIFEYTAWE